MIPHRVYRKVREMDAVLAMAQMPGEIDHVSKNLKSFNISWDISPQETTSSFHFFRSLAQSSQCRRQNYEQDLGEIICSAQMRIQVINESGGATRPQDANRRLYPLQTDWVDYGRYPLANRYHFVHCKLQAPSKLVVFQWGMLFQLSCTDYDDCFIPCTCSLYSNVCNWSIIVKRSFVEVGGFSTCALTTTEPSPQTCHGPRMLPTSSNADTAPRDFA